MTNSIAKNSLNTLEAEGLELSKKWRSISKADKARFKKSIQGDGFDTRLGKLLQSLKSEGGSKISSQRLRDCNIHIIDKRRRSEALWFVENEKECRQFAKTSKKGFTSLTALQRAMKKASTAKTAKADKVDDKPSKEEQSNVGPEKASPKIVILTASEIAFEVLVQCDANGINIKDFLISLKEQRELLDIKQAA